MSHSSYHECNETLESQPHSWRECHSNIHIINLILKSSCEIQLNLALLAKQFWLWLGVLEVSGCLLRGWGC